MACENEYEPGDMVRVGSTFTDCDDVPLDPSDVFLNVRSPSGLITRYEYGVGAMIVRDGVGTYRADVPVDRPGRWYYYWHSTGNGQAAEEGSFVVRKIRAA